MGARNSTTIGLETSVARSGRGSLWQLTAYFLTLGTIGFGGPVALVGYMPRDLVERRRWIDDEEYKPGLAPVQIMPGPLAAQPAIAIAGYKLARKVNGRDPLLWAIFAALFAITVWAQAELAEVFLLAGFLVLL